MLYDANTQRFKKLLEQQHSFPCDYTFKFIVPVEQEKRMTSLFPKHPKQMRLSRKGKYVSMTVTITADSSDLVIAIYEKAAQIKGLIAL